MRFECALKIYLWSCMKQQQYHLTKFMCLQSIRVMIISRSLVTKYSYIDTFSIRVVMHWYIGYLQTYKNVDHASTREWDFVIVYMWELWQCNQGSLVNYYYRYKEISKYLLNIYQYQAYLYSQTQGSLSYIFECTSC